MRPAVEAALTVARDGLTADPRVLPPPGLQRYLSFTKLSAPALRAIARVVDTDDQFRARVAEAVDESTVGRAGMLWLTRPDGWADEVASLEAEDAAQAAASADVRGERDARRRLAAAQSAAERASSAAQAATAKLDRMRVELAAERARRAAAEQQVGELEGKLAEAGDARAAALHQVHEAQARMAALTAEADAARAAVQVRGESPGVADVPSAELLRFRDAVHAAAGRAAELADELRALEESAVVGPDEDLDRVAAGRRRREAAATVEPRRRPVALPPGLHDDSVDVVDHLLRVPAMLLLVDGYNVSMVGWPEVPVRDQRKRLLAALEEKALRTGAPIEVVFDGADVDAVSVRGKGRPLVRVRFSPPGVEADDVVLDLVRQLPLRRPVTVASSDKRVRHGAHSLGANLLHSRQLVAALRP
ncbi:MAG TPA: NYN domain-containing protein [Acidimicrobiales bacterium]|nr:NYN domain-containing protein [Acidimicrobiales bacterium]